MRITDKLTNAMLLTLLSSIVFLFVCLGVSFIDNQQTAEFLGELFSKFAIVAFLTSLGLGSILIFFNIIEIFEEK